MSYFLRNFIPEKTQGVSTSTSLNKNLNLSFESSFFNQKKVEDEAKVREQYSDLLSKCSNLVFKEGALSNNTKGIFKKIKQM